MFLLISLIIVCILNPIISLYIMPSFRIIIYVLLLFLIYLVSKRTLKERDKNVSNPRVFLSIDTTLSLIIICISYLYFEGWLRLASIMNVIYIYIAMIFSLFRNELLIKEDDGPTGEIQDELQKLKSELDLNNKYFRHMNDYYQQMLNRESSENTKNSEALSKFISKEINGAITDAKAKIFNDGFAQEITQELDKKLLEFEENIQTNMKTYKKDIQKLDSNLNSVLENLDSKNEWIFEILQSFSDKSKSFDKIMEKLNSIKSISEDEKNSIIQLKNLSDNILGIVTNRTNDLVLLSNQEISIQFTNKISEAKKRICIMSPWMNNNVVTDIFKKILENRLKANVEILILYGIGDAAQQKEKNSDNIAKELKGLFSKYSNFKIKRINSHSKIFICDSDTILGSFNFLSFTGDYSGDDRRDEVALLISDNTLTEQIKKDKFDIHF